MSKKAGNLGATVLTIKSKIMDIDNFSIKISLGSWAFTYGPYESAPISFQDTAIRLSEAGYDGIEVGGFEPHITLDRYPTSSSRLAIKRFLSDLGLGVSGYAADFGKIDPVTTGNQEAYLELFSRFIEVSVDLGAPSIRVDCVLPPNSVASSDYDLALNQLSETWRNAAILAENAGVVVVWEFEPAFIFNKPSEIIKVTELVGHPNFKLLFDTSHAYMCGVIGARQVGEKETLAGGVGEFLDQLKNHIGHVHLIDSDGSLYQEDTSTHAPFGLGFIDFKELAPSLRSLPEIEWWCIDLCFWPGAWELVDPSLDFVRNMFKVI